MIHLEETCSIITAALERHFIAEKDFGRGGERTHTWASGWQPCERAMALDLTNPEDRSIDAGGYARMAFGDVYEVAIRTRLETAGANSSPPFTVEGQQERFALLGSEGAGAAAGKPVITGKIDGKIRFHDGSRKPFECKAGEVAKRIRTLDDMLRSPWASRWVYQHLAYLLGTTEPEGLFILGTGGLPTLIPIVLEEHLDKAESFYKAAEQAYRVKHDGEPLPDFAANPEHCLRCDHRGKSCAPAWFSGDGPWVSDDPGLEKAVRTVLETKESAKTHDREHNRIKELCRGKELVLIGPYTITGRPWGRGWKTTIQEPKGDAKCLD